jgi:hypothetical protein
VDELLELSVLKVLVLLELSVELLDDELSDELLDSSVSCRPRM